MYSISGATLTHLQDCNPVGLSITVAGLDGNTTLTGTDIVSGSFHLENSCVSGNTIKIGATANAQLEFLIDNHDRGFDAFRFEGAVLTVNVLLSGHDTIPLGLFVVDQQPKVGSTLKIVALDYMAKFNKSYVTDLSYPATLLQISGDVCTKCGVTNSSGTLVNQAYSVQVKPTGVTFREVVAAVAELTGTFGIINRLGQLVLKWYTDTGATIIASDRFSGYELAENNVTITGVKCKSGTIEYLAGTAAYAFLIENNILLQGGEQAIIDAISTARTGFTYRPFSCPVKGYPQLDVGDIIDPLTDTQGGNHVSIITNLEYRLNGTMDISAVGESAIVAGFASASPFTANQKNIIQTVASLETSVQLNPVVESILRMNERAANAFGLFQTIETFDDGSVIIYWHDAATLETSDYISMQSDAGYFWTTAGWNGGSPAWQSGYTAEGDAVFRYLAAKGINADYLTSGQVNTNLIMVGAQTLTESIAGLQTSIAAVSGGGTNAIQNSAWGTYDNPSLYWWYLGLTWQLLEKRIDTWAEFEANIATWAIFEAYTW